MVGHVRAAKQVRSAEKDPCERRRHAARCWRRDQPAQPLIPEAFHLYLEHKRLIVRAERSDMKRRDLSLRQQADRFTSGVLRYVGEGKNRR